MLLTSAAGCRSRTAINLFVRSTTPRPSGTLRAGSYSAFIFGFYHIVPAITILLFDDLSIFDGDDIV